MDAAAPAPLAGSIPACAGEPCPNADAECATGVYPRVCGGTTEEHNRIVFDRGLSPRVRGNPRTLMPPLTITGSIPACAGEPHRPHHRQHGKRVYPRVCGGTRRRLRRQQPGCGLSPRVRGNPGRRRLCGKAGRSIPACAGEPLLRPARPGIWTVYPRVCGGTRRSPRPATASAGLSPRVRGNHCSGWWSIASWRSIPACAGEPSASKRLTRRRWVYPRVCGGTLRRPSLPAGAGGLSPRVPGLSHMERFA